MNPRSIGVRLCFSVSVFSDMRAQETGDFHSHFKLLFKKIVTEFYSFIAKSLAWENAFI